VHLQYGLQAAPFLSAAVCRELDNEWCVSCMHVHKEVALDSFT